MKKLKKILFFILLISTVILSNNIKSYATVKQYSNNVIPVMTSNTSPSGVASADSYYNNFSPYRAFDGDYKYEAVPHMWMNNDTRGWLAYEFNNPRKIVKYTIQTQSLNSSNLYQFVKDWNFEGWDGSNWVILDIQKNISWVDGEKKEFTFSNTNYYKKYRLNIFSNASNGSHSGFTIGELEMMEDGTPQVSAPTNLLATVSDKHVNLAWDVVNGATSYTVKRSETPGGPYIDITSKSSITTNTFVDSDFGLVPGKTYYYIVTAIIEGTESPNSNEASSTLITPTASLKLVLEVNQEQQLSIQDDLADNLNMTWTSSNTSVATVDVNGNVKALKTGTTLITCTSPDGSYTNTIKVLVVRTIVLAIDLKVGKTCLLIVDDLTNTTKVTWESGDQSVASISTTGKVTALSKGLTLITAYDDQGNEIDHVYIRVRN
jgi:hypothetical protein